jgi:cytochrome b
MRDVSEAPTIRAKLWDGPTRIVHWALVALIGFSWWAGETHHMDWHRLSGYAVLGLLVFRLFWGFVGSGTSRFASFVKAPAATLAYIRTLPSRTHVHAHGHNPLGAWSVLAILTALVVQVGSGLFAVDIDGLESGPLSDRVSFDTGRLFARWHHLSFTALQILVALHIAAIVFYAVYKRADLVGPMVTGTGKFKGHPDIAFAPLWRAAVIAIVAGLIAWWTSKGLRF